MLLFYPDQVPVGNFEVDWLLHTTDIFFSRALRDQQQVFDLDICQHICIHVCKHFSGYLLMLGTDKIPIRVFGACFMFQLFSILE